MPYSENATLTEYFDLGAVRNGDQLLVVTAIVDDAKYLQQPFVVSTQFKKQRDACRMGAYAMFRHLVMQRPLSEYFRRSAIADLDGRHCAEPTFAQSSSGSWAARNHEDGLERVPDPYAVDYPGSR